METVLTIGFVAMSLVAAIAIGYGFYLTKKLNSFRYSQKDAYDFLKEQRRKAGLQ
ncbi:hypothetical protein HO675_10220 [Streptococcus suis]|nr:hypothetical protein [Streptococcus suis]